MIAEIQSTVCARLKNYCYQIKDYFFVYPKKSIAMVIVSLVWTFCGVVTVDHFEDEGYMIFFIKEKPTLFQFKFRDSYRSDAYGAEVEWRKRQDDYGNWLMTSPEFEEFADYCWHRFGISDTGRLDNYDLCVVKSGKDKGSSKWPWPY
ncbi:hypothetical protein [Xylophilus sp. GOD-11R]|uniref:hypothetical protein n=1 Tax=Xylophilus sp. GOD-11R TaxID=3089814 RepID=UPI00298C35F1|nr:hypothetical protein [Xylophilus sp. GOD-11R]WPB57114.1 hypothetical protein R9X41_00155 [Xylophilus sp. GOD-11R]